MDKDKKMEGIENQKGFLEYSRDVLHKHSPAAQKFITFVIGHIDSLMEQGKQGKKLAWNSTPCSMLFYACGVTPLTSPDIARFGDPSFIPIAESVLQIPSETCAMIKAIAGGYYQFRNSPCTRVAVSGLRCEPEMVMMGNLQNLGYDVYMMDIAKNPPGACEERKEYIRKMYEEEYRKLAKWLNGTGLDETKLYDELVKANRIRSKLVELIELGKKHNLYYRTVPTMLAICGCETYFGHPEIFESLIEEMIKEIKKLPDGAYHSEDLVKLEWSGARGVDFSVYNAVDITGGYIAAWNLPNNIYRQYDLSKEPFEAMMDFDFGEKGAQNLDDMCVSDENLYRETGAKGIILYSTLGCTFGTTNTEMKRRYLTEKGIPTMVLTGTAQIGEATGQVLTRLKAFVEMLS